MNKQLIIIGAGGHARVVIDTALRLNYKIKGIVDLNYNGKDELILGIPVIGGINVLSDVDADRHTFAVAIGANQARKQQMAHLEQIKRDVVTLIHPQAIVSTREVKIGRGTFLNAGCIVNACAQIGEGTIINTGVIVEHECKVGSFVHLAPNSTLAGRVQVGNESFIGMGATVHPNICIGQNVIIGANSTITLNVDNGQKVVGINRKL